MICRAVGLKALAAIECVDAVFDQDQGVFGGIEIRELKRTARINRNSIKGDGNHQPADDTENRSGRQTDDRIVEAIRRRGSLSLKELIARTGLSRTSVAMHLRRLTAQTIVEPTANRRSPKERYRLTESSERAFPIRCKKTPNNNADALPCTSALLVLTSERCTLNGGDRSSAVHCGRPDVRRPICPAGAWAADAAAAWAEASDPEPSAGASSRIRYA